MEYKMRQKRNTKNMINVNWKNRSQNYLNEMQSLLDRLQSIENQDLKKEILYKILKCDNELTILAETLFDEYYEKGKKDARKA